MEFLKRVVPPVLSGDLVLDAREKIPGNSPRLLKVRRLSSAASERTVGDPGGNKLCGNHDDRCLHQQTAFDIPHSATYLESPCCFFPACPLQCL